MDGLQEEALRVAVAILPGFLTVKIKGFFLPPQRADSLDRFLEVVSFAVANYLVAGALLWLASAGWLLLVAGVTHLPGPSEPLLLWGLGTPQYLYLLGASSVVLGLAAGIVVGNDTHYRLARRLGWTHRTGRQDVWQDVFVDVEGNWLVCHLSDGRRLLGWADIYSENGAATSLFLRNAAWVEDDGRQLPVEGEGVLVTERAEIKYIEFRGSEGRASDDVAPIT